VIEDAYCKLWIYVQIIYCYRYIYLIKWIVI